MYKMEFHYYSGWVSGGEIFEINAKLNSVVVEVGVELGKIKWSIA